MFDHIPLTLAQGKDVTDADTNPQPTPTTDGKTSIGKGGESPAPTDGSKTGEGAKTGTPNQPIGPQQQQQNPFGGTFIFILLGMFILMIFFSMRTQKRERKKREALLGALKKGDRVQTIGGILGSVIEVREHKVVVKIDENNNTKMTFARTAVQTIFEDKSDIEEAELSKTN